MAFAILFLLLFQSILPLEQLETRTETSSVIHSDSEFNKSGYTSSDVHYSSDGEAHLTRPEITWTTPTQSMISIRTGTCSVAIPSLDEIWVMGGRTDPNPTQSNDEVPTDLVERMDMTNKSWSPAETSMPSSQQYCEAELIGDKVYVIGDWYRNSNPTKYPDGKVQIYDVSTNIWTNGSSMPSNNERGLGGMAAAGGMLYYAGGVRNPSGTDATNKTWRYDPGNNQWSQMASMNHPRASFPLVNFHGQLYAIGGFQGTSTWNRPSMDYVERYDPGTNIWTNLSALPVTMFGWGATVYNDEIVLVGGYNGGAKKSVYQWNPIEETWLKGRDIGSIGHFDASVEALNGSIIWGSGDTSSYPYQTWNQMFSADSEFQNASDYAEGWITSPVISLAPGANGKATPITIELNGTNRPGGVLSFQYRAHDETSQITNLEWQGDDGTINSTFDVGTHELNIPTMASNIQYRIKINVTNLADWDEPNLDFIEIEAEHAAFLSAPQTMIHPRGASLKIQTSHHLVGLGQMYLEMASCDSTGVIDGPWSKLSWDNSLTESDTQGMFLASSALINATNNGETIIDWSMDFGDLIGIDRVCTRVGSVGSATTLFSHSTIMEVDRNLSVLITGLGNHEIGTPVAGDIPINFGIEHIFLSSGDTLSSGDVQARLIFNIESLVAGTNASITWVNQTTPWQELTIGSADTIQWIPPIDVSGRFNITLEARSDQPFNMSADSNSSWLILDNDNPIFSYSIPVNQSYVNSKNDRMITISIADTSGFAGQNITTEIWVQGMDDGSDGSFPDGIAQDSEYREVNHSMENIDSIWWFNLSQSDSENADHDIVHLRVVGQDQVGNQIEIGQIWWETRDAQNAVIESLSNSDNEQMWEVARQISWTIVISDANAITDIMNIELELGDDDDFGIIYDVADYTCSVKDLRIDSDKLQCGHSIENDLLTFTATLVAGWEIDLSMVEVGQLDIIIEDLDGKSRSTYPSMWMFSDDFEFSIDMVEDISGAVTGMITNESLVRSSDELRLQGSIVHTLSGQDYQGDLNVKWWGTLQGQSWSGGSSITVVDGVIDTIIPMPMTGGQMDINIAIMDPMETRTLGLYEAPIFQIDNAAPIILDSSAEEYSRYHLNRIEIGVNIVEDDGWNGELELNCQVISTEVEWDVIAISKTPTAEFQGKTLFSYTFDFSGQGDPSELSPEARLDCWATGIDDSGWELLATNANTPAEPWLSSPLNDIGPNINLVDVELTGNIEPGSSVTVEVTIKNTGEDLDQSFNVSVYTIEGEVRTLVGLFTENNFKANQGKIKRVAIVIPQDDWSLEVIVDEDQNIWELNEDDNYWSKEYIREGPSSLTLYIGGAVGIIVLLGLYVIVKSRGEDELSANKKNMPNIEDLPQDMRKKSGPPLESGPKKGPPPAKKPENVAVDAPTADVSAAMAALSLDSLPGAQPVVETAKTFADLPAGGEYEYLTEATIYSGPEIGKWRLEDDQSFTKVE